MVAPTTRVLFRYLRIRIASGLGRAEPMSPPGETPALDAYAAPRQAPYPSPPMRGGESDATPSAQSKRGTPLSGQPGLALPALAFILSVLLTLSVQLTLLAFTILLTLQIGGSPLTLLIALSITLLELPLLSLTINKPLSSSTLLSQPEATLLTLLGQEATAGGEPRQSGAPPSTEEEEAPDKTDGHEGTSPTDREDPSTETCSIQGATTAGGPPPAAPSDTETPETLPDGWPQAPLPSDLSGQSRAICPGLRQ